MCVCVCVCVCNLQQNLGSNVHIHLMLHIRYSERIMIDVINLNRTKSEVSSTLCPI